MVICEEDDDYDSDESSSEDEEKKKSGDEDGEDEDETGKKKKKKKGEAGTEEGNSKEDMPGVDVEDEKAKKAEKRKALVDNLLDPNAAGPSTKKSRMDPFPPTGKNIKNKFSWGSKIWYYLKKHLVNYNGRLLP